MEERSVLDFDRLLAPCPGDNPAGVDVRSGAEENHKLFGDVRDARNLARSNEEAATKVNDASPPDWRSVRDKALVILERHSKHLWVSAWLIEALVRLEGFAGLRDGLRLTRQLCERYWDRIHPRPDDDGISTTTAKIDGLNSVLIAPINSLPITGSSSLPNGTGADYFYVHELTSAKDVARSEELQKQLDAAARDTPAEFFDELNRDIQAARDELRLLMEFLDNNCGQEEDGTSLAPSLGDLRKALESAAERVAHLSGRPAATDEKKPDDDTSDEKSTKSGGGGKSEPLGRDQALREIERIAAFFERTEPHSPVSYSLRQAVKWGRMKLPELLAELIANEDVRTELGRVTGVKIADDARNSNTSN